MTIFFSLLYHVMNLTRSELSNRPEISYVRNWSIKKSEPSEKNSWICQWSKAH
ncbi:hypothetical protein HanIR_Chr12g0604171 [Helianthus annuus]|nr:hypothetical protein HanIR_Chr12g0604171 [Helianthus annuus]